MSGLLEGQGDCMKLDEENTGTIFIFTILFLLSGSLNFSSSSYIWILIPSMPR